MIISRKIADETAALLLQINAIKLNNKNYFTWASGWRSPIYCDNRILLSYPDERFRVATQFSEFIKIHYPQTQVIAGVATGAIGLGTLVAHMSNLPFVYVRPEPKKHGRKNQIEGELRKNQFVVVIEDLISTGNSSINVVDALRESSAEVLAMVAVFSYGFSATDKKMKEKGLNFHTLSDYESLLAHALATGYISKEDAELLKTWRLSPDTWNQ